MPNSILRGISFKESVLWSCENCSSLYDENYLSSLNVKEPFALQRFPDLQAKKGRLFRLKIFFWTTHKHGI